MNRNDSSAFARQLEYRLVEFAVRIVAMSENMPKTYAGQYFSKQILRSGSAPALIYAEVRGAESDKDFKHKMSLVLKELRETHVNLQIVQRSKIFPSHRLEELLNEANQLVAIFTKSVKTIKDKLK